MKKIYKKPEMVVVTLQHRSFICNSQVRGVAGGDVGYGGGSSNNEGGNIRTKESSGIWDEEW